MGVGVGVRVDMSERSQMSMQYICVYLRMRLSIDGLCQWVNMLSPFPHRLLGDNAYAHT